jgi:hypothetical protein
MFHKLASPFVIAGLMLMVFGGLLLLEAVFCSIVIEAILALGISVAGWFVRRAGIARHITLRTWFRLLILGLPTLLILYVAGCFVLMDRSRPTFWSMSARPHYFDSSLRMVPNEWGDLLTLSGRGIPRKLRFSILCFGLRTMCTFGCIRDPKRSKTGSEGLVYEAG